MARLETNDHRIEALTRRGDFAAREPDTYHSPVHIDPDYAV
jgi:hypothetical protein